MSESTPKNPALSNGKRKAGQNHSRRSDDYHTGQVLWTFFVAIAVALAALHNVYYSEKANAMNESVASRSPGSAALIAPNERH